MGWRNWTWKDTFPSFSWLRSLFFVQRGAKPTQHYPITLSYLVALLFSCSPSLWACSSWKLNEVSLLPGEDCVRVGRCNRSPLPTWLLPVNAKMQAYIMCRGDRTRGVFFSKEETLGCQPCNGEEWSAGLIPSSKVETKTQPLALTPKMGFSSESFMLNNNICICVTSW